MEKETAHQKSICSTLKISPARVNEIISVLEHEGFLEKKKSVRNGRQINTVVLIKNDLDPHSYIDSQNEEPQKDKVQNPIEGRAIFESPCFFCNQLDTCGEDSKLSYLNCPRLNDWINKPL